MKSSGRARIDQVVSVIAWKQFPALHLALQRWADLSAGESGDLVVSAVPIQDGALSVRVTRTEGDGHPMDWLEWIAPPELLEADQSAVDHLATRETHRLALMLATRAGTQVRPELPETPAAREPAAGPSRPRGLATANRNGRRKAMTTGRRKTAAASAAEPTPAPARGSARRKTTAATAPAMPRAETRSAKTLAAPARTAATAKPAATRAAAKPAAAKMPSKLSAAKPAAKPAATGATKATAAAPAKSASGKSRGR